MKKKSGTDWKKLETMTDEEIDYSDIPPLTEDFFKHARLYLPSSDRNLIQLEPDVLEWFRTHGGDYQTRINHVLRQYIKVQEK